MPHGDKEIEIPAPSGNRRRAAKVPRKIAKQRASAGSKTFTCLALLERPERATVAELQKATGWQPHSVRGFLAGAVKNKLGCAIVSTKDDRGRVYRIAAKESPVPGRSESAMPPKSN